MVADGDFFPGWVRDDDDFLLGVPGCCFADDELDLVAVLLEARLDVEEDLVGGHELGAGDGARRGVCHVPFRRGVDQEDFVFDGGRGGEVRIDMFEEVVSRADAGVRGAEEDDVACFCHGEWGGSVVFGGMLDIANTLLCLVADLVAVKCCAER